MLMSSQMQAWGGSRLGRGAARAWLAWNLEGSSEGSFRSPRGFFLLQP